MTAEQNTLTVTAERSWAPVEGDELVISERPQGTFSRQLLLGDNLDTDQITAHYDQGVLTITIPVRGAVEDTQGAGHTRREA